jgi:PAS domain S-box-containing protein
VETKDSGRSFSFLEWLRPEVPNGEGPGPVSSNGAGKLGPEAGAALQADARARPGWQEATEATVLLQQRELQNVSRLLLDLFESSPDGYLVTDARGIIVAANQAAANLLHVRKEFLAGHPLAFFLAENVPGFYQVLVGLNRGIEPARDWQVSFRRANGPPLQVELRVALVGSRDPAGPREYRWVLHDISDLQEMQQTLRGEQLFGDDLAELAQALILVVSPEGKVLRTNPYLRSASGFTENELRGRDWAEALLPEAGREQGRELVRGALESRQWKALNCPLIARGGQLWAIAWTARVRENFLQGLPGSPPGSSVLLLGHDITDLEESQRQALRAERLAAIGEMVAGLAHESRNALQRSQACLELLRLELHDQPRALELLGRLQEVQEHLHHLHDDVRQYASTIRLDRCFCSLAEVWQEAWALLGHQRHGRDAELREEVAGMDLDCDVDRFRLVQVFRNVLENALLACADPVRIVITCTEAGLDGLPALRIAVRDNGPGLTPEQRPKVFEPFYTTRVRGTGLGLAITRRLVEAHGGTIEVGGTPPACPEGGGPGAEFIITLPRRHP